MKATTYDAARMSGSCFGVLNFNIPIRLFDNTVNINTFTNAIAGINSHVIM